MDYKEIVEQIVNTLLREETSTGDVATVPMGFRETPHTPETLGLAGYMDEPKKKKKKDDDEEDDLDESLRHFITYPITKTETSEVPFIGISATNSPKANKRRKMAVVMAVAGAQIL